jgi:hypothetical protein
MVSISFVERERTNADITFVHVSGRQLIAIDWLLTFEFKRSGIREC